MLDLPDGANLGLIRLRFLECLDQEFKFESIILTTPKKKRPRAQARGLKRQ